LHHTLLNTQRLNLSRILEKGSIYIDGINVDDQLHYDNPKTPHE